MRPVAQTLVFLGLAGALVQPAKAPLAYVSSGEIHCPNGHIFPTPTVQEPSSGVEESASPSKAAIARQSSYEAARKRCLEDDENEQVLAGRTGDWAAFWAAWDQGRSKIYYYVIGKWSGYLAVFILVLYVLFGRKGR